MKKRKIGQRADDQSRRAERERIMKKRRLLHTSLKWPQPRTANKTNQKNAINTNDCLYVPVLQVGHRSVHMRKSDPNPRKCKWEAGEENEADELSDAHCCHSS